MQFLLYVDRYMASAEKTTSPLHVWNSVLRSSKEIIVSNINVIMITLRGRRRGNSGGTSRAHLFKPDAPYLNPCPPSNRTPQCRREHVERINQAG